MNRRSFLKNSIGALLFGVINSNPIAKHIIQSVETDFNKSHDILLFLIETIDGKLKIHGSKWLNCTTKKLSPFKYKLDSFKPLGIFPSDIAYQEKRKLWKQYDIKGQCTFVSYNNALKSGLKAKETKQIIKICASGGRVSGKKNKEMNHGLFKFTKEERIQICRKGGKVSAPKMLKWCKENNHWEKLGEVHKGVPKSKEQKEKISNKLKGRKLSKETCEKMSKSRIGVKRSDSTLINLKKAAQKRSVSVSKFTLDNIWLEDIVGLNEAANSIGQKNGRAIQLVCNYYRDNLTKGSKQCGGYIWKYKN